MSLPTGHDVIIYDHEVCSVNRFDRTKRIRCVDNQFVYKTDELTIMNEVSHTLLLAQKTNQRLLD